MFFKTDGVQCRNCHKIAGQGKEVGPDLSEIGSKLTREALYVSILDPSAGISHNYEMYLIELASGNIVSGVIISRTDDAVVLKDKEAIEKVMNNEITHAPSCLVILKAARFLGNDF